MSESGIMHDMVGGQRRRTMTWLSCMPFQFVHWHPARPMLAPMSHQGCFHGALLLLFGAALGACTLGACSGISSLEGPGASPAPSEQEAIRHQVERALGEGRYKTAWNQEIEAGADRARLETIALSALAENSAHAADMFTALREKWGQLSAPGRKRVDELIAAAKSADKWIRALSLELDTADDPPAYLRAWSLYAAAPVARAPALLEGLQAAQAAARERAQNGNEEERDD